MSSWQEADWEDRTMCVKLRKVRFGMLYIDLPKEDGRFSKNVG